MLAWLEAWVKGEVEKKRKEAVSRVRKRETRRGHACVRIRK